MAWAERRFKEKSKVWIEVDEDGEPVVDNGRVSMRYQNEEGAKVYSASVRNVAGLDSESAKTDASKPGKPGKKKSLKTNETSTFDDLVWQEPAGPVVTAGEIPDEIAELDAPPEGVWEFYTDGACSGNPGACGWGWVLRHDGEYLEAHQYIGTGTNNIAELMAIRTALDHVLDESADVHIHSDSSYCIGVLTKGWKAKKNKELIESIRARIKEFEKAPTFFKVKGHSGHPLNERADFQATSSIEDR